MTLLRACLCSRSTLAHCLLRVCRDTPPRSARLSLERLQQACAALPAARIASVGGRYFGMDRDKRWDRVERAWRSIVDADGAYDYADALQALETLQEAFRTDVSAILKAARQRAGGAVDPVSVYRASRYRMIKAEERPAQIGISAGII